MINIYPPFYPLYNNISIRKDGFGIESPRKNDMPLKKKWDSWNESLAAHISRCTDRLVWLGRLARHVGQGRRTCVTGCRHSCHERWDRYSLCLRGSSPQALTLFGGARFIVWYMSLLFWSNADGARRIFLDTESVSATARRPKPP